MSKEKEQLLKDLSAAMREVVKIGALPAIDGASLVTEFGQKNLGQYLGYIASLKFHFFGAGGKPVATEEELKSLVSDAGLTDENLQNPQFFHYFLLEFHRLRAESASKEGQEPRVVDAYSNRSFVSGDVGESLDVGGNKIFYSETIGRRGSQEDAFVIGAAKKGGDWENPSRVPALLQRQFREMGERIRNYCIGKNEESGSTAVATHYSTDRKLTIANLGDSRAVLFIRQGDGNVRWVRLTNDQEPLDVLEKSRIEGIGGHVSIQNKVQNDEMKSDGPQYGLMAARSFGDIGIANDGAKKLISYEPDIYQYDIPAMLETEEQAFLMTSCDGMYDHGKGNEATYAAALKTWFDKADVRKKWQDNMAEYLRDYAIALGSTDNVTVCISDITQAPAEPVITAVFDGHGGQSVSSIAAEAFAQATLQNRETGVVQYPLDLDPIKNIAQGLPSATVRGNWLDNWEAAPSIVLGGAGKGSSLGDEAVRYIVERHAKFQFAQQRGFNESFKLDQELRGTTVETYIKTKLKSASQQNVQKFLAEGSEDELNFGNNRDFHGAYHSIITSVYARMFADFYSKHFAGRFGIPEGGLSEEERNLSMVLTSAHDIARFHDSVAKDEHNNAFYLALILRDKFRLSEELAINLASQIARKDDRVAEDKSIQSRITQCADCAAIIRVCGVGGFSEGYLDARKDVDSISDEAKKSAAKGDLKIILDFAKAFEPKMMPGGGGGYYGRKTTTFDDAINLLEGVAQGIEVEGQKIFLGYLGGLRASAQIQSPAPESKSEFVVMSSYNSGGYYDFIKEQNEALRDVPVAITGSTNGGIFWEVAGGGMNGDLATYVREKWSQTRLNEINGELASAKPTVKEAIGTITKINIEKDFPSEKQVQSILYSASPNLGGKSASEAEKVMVAFGKKFRNQLNEKGITEFCLPLFSGGIYSGGFSQENIAKWLMKGWFDAEKEASANGTNMAKVKVHLGHKCLVAAVGPKEPKTQERPKISQNTREKILLNFASDHMPQFFSAEFTGPESSSTTKVNILSWNVLGECYSKGDWGLGEANNPWNYRESRNDFEKRRAKQNEVIKDFVEEEGLDVICLQEYAVNFGTKKSFQNLCDDLKRQLGGAWNYKFVTSEEKKKSNVIFYNSAKLEAYEAKLGLEINGTKHATELGFRDKSTDRKFVVSNVHSSSNSETAVQDYLGRERGAPFIAVGDFNTHAARFKKIKPIAPDGMGATNFDADFEGSRADNAKMVVKDKCFDMAFVTLPDGHGAKVKLTAWVFDESLEPSSSQNETTLGSFNKNAPKKKLSDRPKEEEPLKMERVAYQKKLLSDEYYQKLTAPLEEDEVRSGLLRLSEARRGVNHEEIERLNPLPQGEEINLPLWLKISDPERFKNDEFTDYDVRSYYGHLFTKKYPQAAAFADYAAVGVGNGGSLLSDRMAETIRNKKWGFYSYSTGGHWVLVVVSPDHETMCLNSIGSGDLGSELIDHRIQKDIKDAFGQARVDIVGEIKYYGLSTQRGVQCGLHSVLAAEEILKSICDKSTATPEQLHSLMCLENLSRAVDFGTIDQLSSLLTVVQGATRPLAEKNIEILRRAVVALPEEGLDRQGLEALLSKSNSTRQDYATWYDENSKNLSNLYKGALEGAMSGFSISDIEEKCLDVLDPIRHQPNDQEILRARWSASAQQFEDQRGDAYMSVIAEKNDLLKVEMESGGAMNALAKGLLASGLEPDRVAEIMSINLSESGKNIAKEKDDLVANVVLLEADQRIKGREDFLAGIKNQPKPAPAQKPARASTAGKDEEVFQLGLELISSYYEEVRQVAKKVFLSGGNRTKEDAWKKVSGLFAQRLELVNLLQNELSGNQTESLGDKITKEITNSVISEAIEELEKEKEKKKGLALKELEALKANLVFARGLVQPGSGRDVRKMAKDEIVTETMSHYQKYTTKDSPNPDIINLIVDQIFSYKEYSEHKIGKEIIDKLLPDKPKFKPKPDPNKPKPNPDKPKPKTASEASGNVVVDQKSKNIEVSDEGEVTLKLQKTNPKDPKGKKIELDYKVSNSNKFLEFNDSGELEIKGKDFREEVMRYYQDRKDKTPLNADALEVLNIYAASPNTAIIPRSVEAVSPGRGRRR